MRDKPNSPTSITRTSHRKPGRRMTNKEREQAQETFLKAYALNGNIMLSCKQANIDRSTFYQWEEHDTEFSVLYHQTERNFADFALAEFRKRAMEGYERPVISMGRVVYEEIPMLNPDGTPQLDSRGKPITRRGKQQMERVVSDTLLAMLIKKHFPEYREKQPDVNVNVNNTQAGTIPIDTKNLTNEELAMLKQIALNQKAREANR